MNSFGEKRVFRFVSDGVAQISDFPEIPPPGESGLEIRIKHFTEIENFGFLVYVLAHELGGKAQPIQTLADLEVPDDEVQTLVTILQGRRLNDEELGDELLDADINWEHFVASTNDKLIPGDPLKITDTKLQAKIDSLDELSEALGKEVNRRSKERAKKRRS